MAHALGRTAARLPDLAASGIGDTVPGMPEVLAAASPVRGRQRRVNVLDHVAARTARKITEVPAPPALFTHMDLPEPYGPDPIVFGLERYWEPPSTPRRMVCEPCGLQWTGAADCWMCGQPGVRQFAAIGRGGANGMQC
jgi:hypothetical protein